MIYYVHTHVRFHMFIGSISEKKYPCCHDCAGSTDNPMKPSANNRSLENKWHNDDKYIYIYIYRKKIYI